MGKLLFVDQIPNTANQSDERFVRLARILTNAAAVRDHNPVGRTDVACDGDCLVVTDFRDLNVVARSACGSECSAGHDSLVVLCAVFALIGIGNSVGVLLSNVNVLISHAVQGTIGSLWRIFPQLKTPHS